jgi:hypothetical protein
MTKRELLERIDSTAALAATPTGEEARLRAGDVVTMLNETDKEIGDLMKVVNGGENHSFVTHCVLPMMQTSMRKKLAALTRPTSATPAGTAQGGLDALKRGKNYLADLEHDLRDPEYAVEYLLAAAKDSDDAFRVAVRDVVRATAPSPASTAPAEAIIKDLAMLVRRLCAKHPNKTLTHQAVDYLTRKGLQGSVLRESQAESAKSNLDAIRDMPPKFEPKPELNDCSPGDVIAAYSDGTIVLDDGITTHDSVRAEAFLRKQAEAPSTAELSKGALEAFIAGAEQMRVALPAEAPQGERELRAAIQELLLDWDARVAIQEGRESRAEISARRDAIAFCARQLRALSAPSATPDTEKE